MGARLYLRDAALVVSGSLPSSRQGGSLVPWGTNDIWNHYAIEAFYPQAGALPSAPKALTPLHASSGESVILDPTGGVNSPGAVSAHAYWGAWAAELGDGSIAAQDWRFNWAAGLGNYALGGTTLLGTNQACLYVWRPSIGAKVGTIFDNTGVHPANHWWTTPGQDQYGFTNFSTPGPNSRVVVDNTAQGAALSVQKGDLLILEVWGAVMIGANAGAGHAEFLYNGSVVTTTHGQPASVSGHASFIEALSGLPLPGSKEVVRPFNDGFNTSTASGGEAELLIGTAGAVLSSTPDKVLQDHLNNPVFDKALRPVLKR